MKRIAFIDKYNCIDLDQVIKLTIIRDVDTSPKESFLIQYTLPYDIYIIGSKEFSTEEEAKSHIIRLFN